VSALYLETSAVLRWLLDEPSGVSVVACIDSHEQVATSVLTNVEVARALRRAESQGLLNAAEHARLLGLFHRAAGAWYCLEMTPAVRERAAQTFPSEPVRTLDTLHLASALELLGVFPDLEVLSFDARILGNLHPLGLPAA
jgi:predicted nucleic acid-binding protein